MKRKNVCMIFAILIIAALTAGMLDGCGKQDGESKEKQSENVLVKGRYIEEEIEIPIKDGEKVIDLSETGDGNPVLDISTESHHIDRYVYSGGKWEKTSLEWLDSLYQGENMNWVRVLDTEDGTQLVLGMDQELKTHLARSKDGENGVELSLPFLEETKDDELPGAICQIQVDGEGNYWLQDLYHEKVYVVSPDTLKVLSEVNTVQCESDMQKLVFTGKDGITAVNTDEGVFTLYDGQQQEVGSFPADMAESASLCGDGKNWYLASEEGITRIKPGNDVKEVIMDGSMGSMGLPINSIEGMSQGTEEDFYILYTQWKTGTHSLAHYVYDKDIAATPENVLQVFSLSENDTTRQAAVDFQRTHADVKIEFRAYGKEAGEVTSDDIRTLNTELLGGNGADILLLDGLPADTYMEKGLLLDLTDLADSLMKEDSYLESMLKNTAQKDGKIYGLPEKFKIPVMYGEKSVITAAGSLESFSKYVEEHGDSRILGITTKEYIRDFLFQMYQDEILEKDGSVDKDKLRLLLETAGKIVENAKTEIFEKEEMGSIPVFINPGEFYAIKHSEMLSTTVFSNLLDMALPYAIMREKNCSPEPIKNYYIPEGILGINRNTKQEELAKEFIRYLFSEKIQSAQLDDGLPVLQSALKNKEQETESDYAKSFSLMSSWNLDGEEIELEGEFPTKEEVSEMIGLCSKLTEPVNQDRAVWEIYQSETDRFLEGAAGAQEAAENVAKKVELYLAE